MLLWRWVGSETWLHPGFELWTVIPTIHPNIWLNIWKYVNRSQVYCCCILLSACMYDGCISGMIVIAMEKEIVKLGFKLQSSVCTNALGIDSSLLLLPYYFIYSLTWLSSLGEQRFEENRFEFKATNTLWSRMTE